MNQSSAEVRGLSPVWYGPLSLPGGVAAGFMGVTLSYLLRHNGVSVAAIAGLGGLLLLPQTWKFLMGPVVDICLTGPIWYLIGTTAMIACFLALAFVPLKGASLPLLGVLALIMGAATAAANCALSAAMAQTTPDSRRGAVAGWINTGNLGGPGLGGGAGLWLATHAAEPSSRPYCWRRSVCSPRRRVLDPDPAPNCGNRPDRAGQRPRAQPLEPATHAPGGACGAGGDHTGLPRRRREPVSRRLGDWHASADLVAGVTGVLGGLVTLPGCLAGGYLCDRFPRRIVYVSAAFACALGEAAMAWVPREPAWFASMVLGNAFLLGIGYAALSAVIFECLGPRSAATVGSTLSSLANVPLVVMVAVVGAVQTRHGSTAMLYTEAGVAVVSVAVYAALAYAWRPRARTDFDAVLVTVEA